MKNKIYECIVGSHAYGTNIEGSDIDIKGIYQQTLIEVAGIGTYQEQINIDKDTTYYEIKRFLELLSTSNPTALEMLYVDNKFVKYISPDFKSLIVDNRQLFLTKNIFKSFGGYAVSQIQKAKGLNKKMNWEKDRIERKTPIDFCYVNQEGSSIPIKTWLKNNNFFEEFVGLSKINHMINCYVVYYDYPAHYGKQLNKPIESFGYRGIQHDNGNDVLLSSIPKEQVGQEMVIMYFNKDYYSVHCKDYKEYQDWLSNRNIQRYVDIKNHGQQIDGKNMLHCMRLLDCAIEIAQTNNLTVFRPNHKELINIRLGKVNLETVIKQAEEKLLLLNELAVKSNLPEKVNLSFINQFLKEMRK